MQTVLDTIKSELAIAKLQILGQCSAPDETGTLLLIGPDEPAFWPTFTQSPEYQDGLPDPLDRWSNRTLSSIAKKNTVEAVFPFEGPPYHPFYPHP